MSNPINNQNPWTYSHKAQICAEQYAETGLVTISRDSGLTIQCSEGMAQLLVSILRHNGVLRSDMSPPVAFAPIQDVPPVGATVASAAPVQAPPVANTPIVAAMSMPIITEKKVAAAAPAAVPTDMPQAPAKRGRKPKAVETAPEVSAQPEVQVSAPAEVAAAAQEDTAPVAVQEESVTVSDPGDIDSLLGAQETVMKMLTVARASSISAEQVIAYLKSTPNHKALLALAPTSRDVEKLRPTIEKVMRAASPLK